MARELPRYRANPRIQPGPVGSGDKGAEAAATTFDAVQKMASQQLIETSVENAKAEGALAGENPGFRPGLSYGAASRAFNESALAANRYTVGADVINRTHQLTNELSQNINGDQTLKEFNASFAGYANGMLETVPMANRAYVKNLLTHQYQKGYGELEAKVTKQNNDILHAQLNDTFTVYTNEMSNAARANDRNSAASLFTQTNEMLAHALKQGLISPQQYNTYQHTNKTLLYENDALGQFNAALKDGKPDEYIAHFREDKSWDKVLSAPQKDALIKKMQGLAKEREQELGLSAASIANTKKDLLLQAKMGLTPDPARLAEVEAHNPQDFHTFQEDLGYAALEGSLVRETQWDSIPRIAEEIKLLQEPLGEAEAMRPGGARLADARRRAATTLKTALSAIERDPAGYYSDSPLYKKALEDYQTIGAGNPTQTLIELQQQAGVEEEKISVFPAAQAALLVNNIQQMPPPQQLAALKQIQEQSGIYTPYALRDLAKNGLPISSQILLGMDSNPQSMGLLPDAMNALSQPVKALEERLPVGVKKTDILNAVKTNLGTYFDSFQGYNGPSASTLNQVQDEVYRLAVYLSGKNGVSPSTAAQQAANAMINNNYQYGEFNGQTYRVPQADAPSSQSWLESIDTFFLGPRWEGAIEGYGRLFIEQLPDIPLRIPSYYKTAFPNLPDNMIEEQYKTLSVAEGYFVTNPSEDGLTFVDRQGVPVRKANGDLIKIKFSEIEQIMSNKEVARAYNREQMKETEAWQDRQLFWSNR